jgi:hypothetical protein
MYHPAWNGRLPANSRPLKRYHALDQRGLGQFGSPPGTPGKLEFLWSPEARVIGGLAAAFHGYRRNQSVGWAIWWSIWGVITPPFTGIVAGAQGFGKRKKRKC